MSEYAVFALLGLGAGAVYALLSIGLVLQHRSSNVINFGHGAMAMFIAYVFANLRSGGDLVLPVVVLPGEVHLSDTGLAALPALAISLAYAAILGAGVYALVFRPLRQAPALANVAATVGLMLTLQGVAVVRFGTNPEPVAPILGQTGTVSVLGSTVPADRLWIAGIAVALAAVLGVVYRYTRFGLATRAAAESQVGASLIGYSFDLLAAANWALAAVLGGAAGILIAPIATLDPGTYTLFIVPALAVALAARFTSFPVAVGLGLLLGMAQSAMQQLASDWPSFPERGAQEALPFLVIILVLALRGGALPGRGGIVEARPPAVPRSGNVVPLASVAFAAAVVGLFVLGAADRLALIQSMQIALICLSLVLLTGYLGQISLAQMAFAGVGGFLLSKLAHGAGVPFPFSALGAALAAVPLGVVVGFPAVRIRGVQLAIVTLGLAVALDELLFKNDSFAGAQGSPVPQLKLLGIDLDIQGRAVSDYPRPVFGIVVLLALTAVGIWIARLRRTPLGRRMLAVRTDERAATAAGVDVARTKLIGFAISALIAGLGGALLGYQQHVLSAESFGVFVSLEVLALAYIGGITYVSGAVFAGLMLAPNGFGATLFDRWLGLGRYQLLLSGIGLMVMAVAHPSGIVAACKELAQRLARSARRSPLATGRAAVDGS